jgi:protein O-GlcNAc transferase
MDINKSIQLAFKHHQAGNLHQAEQSYKKILQKSPNNFDALHMLGVLYSQLSKYDRAIKYIQMALTVNPKSAFAYQNLGNVFIAKKQFGKAIECYNNALNINPSNGDVHYYLGNIFLTTNQNDKAISCYNKAILFKPTNASAFYNLGVLLQEKGRFEDAICSYKKAIELNPTGVDAYNNIGIIFKDMGQSDKAIQFYQKALKINPDDFKLHHNLGLALGEKGQFEEAINSYRRALQVNPNYVETYLNLGNALKVIEKTFDARVSYDLSIFFKPNYFSAYLAKCMTNLHMLYMNESDIITSRENYSKELYELSQTITTTSEDIEEAAKAVGTHQPFCLAYQGMNDCELQRIYGELICRIMSIKYPEFAKIPPMPSCLPGQPLRVGIVSGFFRLHSNWKIPIKGWIKNLDNDRFTLYGYYTGRIKDKETTVARQYFRSFIEDIYSVEDLCEIIRNDNLHIIIYPEVGMDQITVRLATLRLAPIQCASWGHADTTGLPTIDYYLSSDLMEPSNADYHYTEQIVRLPNLSIYYEPFDTKPANITRDSYDLRKNSILYLCSHTPSTHLPQYDDIYPRIAREVEDCQFIFISHYQSKAVTKQFRERISKAFDRFDLNWKEYLVFLPHLDQEHFFAINSVSDIFLDTMEWSGCNSTFEAIHYNLPIVTIPGKLMRGRHSSAILQMMGLTETVAESIENYLEIAIKLGRDHTWRKYISDKIAENKHLIYRDITCINALEKFLENAVNEKA